MTVYVDDAAWEWRGRLWCHLLADSLGELHRFARRLGLKAEWYQWHTKYPHYDITDTMRAKALALGAREADPLMVVRLSTRLRTERDHPSQNVEQLSLL
ncbi:DUF4031 domain-containing protein [Solimonas terrae]|uniref:DUF4031 domain-containing protein n=1 Tax=Solimonas terrae TaxID=1396819 RepID=A0A6M2BUL4_9GAMM|nr:DUF4031 domain-containing protein [Solimonas terrae]